tara:strand:- start:101 stop:415 length:315 start_codon:yes stop_codon:yes gene_type:complete
LPFLLVGPFTPFIRAQNESLRFFALPLGFFCVTGGFNFDPVFRLYFSRPFAVSPAPLLTGSFSPRPIDKETDIKDNSYKVDSIIQLKSTVINNGPKIDFSEKFV